MKAPRLYIIAGEASGDSHGAALIQELHRFNPDVGVHGAGGPRMKKLAGERFVDWSDHAVIGVIDVLKNYGYFRGQFYRMLEEIDRLRPDAVVFIDYPGFNLRLAAAIRKRCPGIRLIYYISPQVWAWNRGRIKKMARILDLMLCIFPFEKDLYEISGLKTEFVGHPMIDSLRDEKQDVGREDGLVGLLPGSRRREVAKIFPVMVEAMRMIRQRVPQARFIAAASKPHLADEMKRILVENGMEEGVCEVESGMAYEIMQRSRAGLVASGTATMEAAYFGLPFALVYRVSWGTYWMARALIKVDFIGMANILAGKEIVREFIQSDATADNLASEVVRILDDSGYREQMLGDLAAVVAKLGDGGASRRAAEAVLQAVALDEESE